MRTSSEKVTSRFCNRFSRIFQFIWLVKCVSAILELKWFVTTVKYTKMKNARAKRAEMKYARAKRAKLQIFIVKFANLWSSCRCRGRACITTLSALHLQGNAPVKFCHLVFCLEALDKQSVCFTKCFFCVQRWPLFEPLVAAPVC